MFWVDFRIYLKDLQLKNVQIQLESFAFLVQTEIDRLSKNYMWDRDEILLQVRLHPTNPKLSCLGGKVHVGNGLEDELFICFVLFEISKVFPNVIIRIFDSDGEFLLIEGSDLAPDWLLERNYSERIFICDGEIVVIPLSVKKGMQQAMEAISQGNILKCPNMQAGFFKKFERLRDPEFNIHYLRCSISKKYAQILYRKPQFVSLAFDALESGGNDVQLNYSEFDSVSATIRLSRIQYAQLLNFPLDNLPFKLTSRLPHKLSAKFKEAALGIKLDYGFELAMNNFSVVNRPIEIDEGDKSLYLENISPSQAAPALNFLQKIRCQLFGHDQLQFKKEEFHLQLNSLNEDDLFESEIQESSDSWLTDLQNEQQDVLGEKQQTIQLEDLLNDFQKNLSYNISDDPSDQYVTEEEFTASSSDSSGSEFSENEFEVLETLLNNPDLLMKILEKNCQSGHESHNQLLVEQLNCIKKLIPSNEMETNENISDECESSGNEEDVDLFEYMRNYDEELEHLNIDRKTSIEDC